METRTLFLSSTQAVTMETRTLFLSSTQPVTMETRTLFLFRLLLWKQDYHLLLLHLSTAFVGLCTTIAGFKDWALYQNCYSLSRQSIATGRSKKAT